MTAPKLMHVVLSQKDGTEGFITDDPRDANWTATGKPKSNCVPAIGDAIRGWLDNPRAKLPRKWALVFDTDEQAIAALALVDTKPASLGVTDGEMEPHPQLAPIREALFEMLGGREQEVAPISPNAVVSPIPADKRVLDTQALDVIDAAIARLTGGGS